MIEALANWDAKKAAGVLARMAIALEDEGNPAATALTEQENLLRSEILAEIKKRLGIASADNPVEIRGKVAELLDQESDRLIGEPDVHAALNRLSIRGDLPTDLYKVHIIDNISSLLGDHYLLERELIEATVRAPSQMQNFGPHDNLNEAPLISLFSKEFITPFPYKNFTMLVAGQRVYTTLHVHQAWRIYSAAVGAADATDLLALLRKFADTYGVDIEVNGLKGHFFMTIDKPIRPSIEVKSPKGRGVHMSHFAGRDSEGKLYSALVVSIDTDRYLATLNKMQISREKIINLPTNKRTQAA